jgi:hypothetical protein
MTISIVVDPIAISNDEAPTLVVVGTMFALPHQHYSFFSS